MGRHRDEKCEVNKPRRVGREGREGRDDKCDENAEDVKQKVKSQCVKSQRVLESKICNLEVKELTVTKQNGGPFVINESTVIVGNHIPLESPCGTAVCQEGVAPVPTPGTPSGGTFILGRSFTGKITFYGVQVAELNLAGFMINNDNDVVLEFINCNQIWIHGGSVNSLNSTAIRVKCCSSLCFSRINTINTKDGYLIEDSYDIQVKNIYMDNITGYAIRFNCSNYLRFNNININNISTYNDSLISGNDSEMIFVNNCAFYKINVVDVSGVRSVININRCFDVKISHISILTTFFTAILDSDLNVYLVHFVDSGSLILGSFIIDGDVLQVSGNSSGELNCIRMQNCNNTFNAHHLFTDNQVLGDASSTSLNYTGVYIDGMDTYTLNSSKICTNFVNVVSPSTSVVVRSFYGANGGNFYISGNLCNQNRIMFPEGATNFVDAFVVGFEIFNISSTIVLQRCSSNNNDGPFEVQGFKVHADNVDFNTFTNIIINNCASNQNFSSGGIVAGFSSTYSNTMFFNSEAMSNFSDSIADCYGFRIPGISGGVQYTVSVFNCSANNNLSTSGSSYGLYGGSAEDLVQALVIKKSTFSSNGPPLNSNPPNPGYGVYLQNILVSSLIGSYLNSNNWGLFIDGGKDHSVISNSAIYNDTGYQISEAPNSIIQKNLAQNNTDGYVDNTTAAEPGTILNSYFTNNAVANTTSYELVTPTVVPWFRFDPTTGAFTPQGPALFPVLSAFSNLSS